MIHRTCHAAIFIWCGNATWWKNICIQTPKTRSVIAAAWGPRGRCVRASPHSRGHLRCTTAMTALSPLLKALVWFWWIDETLSANLVYQSDHEIGSTIPSDEAMVKIMMMVWWPWWSSAWIWKRRKRKTKKLKAKVKCDRSFFCFSDRDT